MSHMTIVPVERIEKLIYLIRGQKVMLDRDLADLYGVETRTLIQGMKRNLQRFPADFMFQLSKKELGNWISQIVISNPSIKMSLRQALGSQEKLTKTLIEVRNFVLTHSRKTDQEFLRVWAAIEKLVQPLTEKDRRRIGFQVDATPKKSV